MSAEYCGKRRNCREPDTQVIGGLEVKLRLAVTSGYSSSTTGDHGPGVDRPLYPTVCPLRARHHGLRRSVTGDHGQAVGPELRILWSARHDRPVPKLIVRVRPRAAKRSSHQEVRGLSADPAGLTARAGPKARPGTFAANLIKSISIRSSLVGPHQPHGNRHREKRSAKGAIPLMFIELDEVEDVSNNQQDPRRRIAATIAASLYRLARQIRQQRR